MSCFGMKIIFEFVSEMINENGYEWRERRVCQKCQNFYSGCLNF